MAGGGLYSDCGWYWLSDSRGVGAVPLWPLVPPQSHGLVLGARSRLGPSWVAGEYTTDHCGWAPLAAGSPLPAGSGADVHGRPAGNACGFGLSAHSFRLVGFNHFWDHQLPRIALPYSQANQILNHTVVSTAFVGSNNRVMNNGLPPSRVVAGTHTGIHSGGHSRIKIAAAAPGVRAEPIGSRRQQTFRFPADLVAAGRG